MSHIGIDLGTTNSLITHWQNDKPHLIKNSLGKVMTPSVVSLDEQGQIVVGEIAKQRSVTHPEKTISEFKRYMGTNKQFKLGKNTFRAEELSALVLKSLISDAEAELGHPIESAIISVPAYFSDAQRKATRDAGKLAGINVKRLINEPTAAAVAYGISDAPDDTTFLIFDIGGGTFDVSILELFDGVMQVNSTAGDNQLGGENFVEAIIDFFFSSTGLRRSKLSNKDFAKLKSACEMAKRSLSSNQSTEITLQVKEKQHSVRLDRSQFEKLCEPLLLRLRTPLERALRDANLHGEDLDEVILVGGASRMPIIRSLVSKMLGKIPRSHINPDEAVSLGAAIQSALVDGNKALSELVLTDVSPYTLGVGIVNQSGFHHGGNSFLPIIERNSPVPISRVDSLVASQDYQTEIKIEIYQGESRLVRDNIRLGELSLNIPRARVGEEIVDVRFTYDVSGLLEVDATVQSTRLTQKIVIKGNSGNLSEKEIQEKLESLKSLKTHPRENAVNALLLARGERLYEISNGELRDYIGQLLAGFDKILEKQIPSEIDKATKELEKIFDQIEKDNPFL